jgi:hypothetical protein
VSSPCSDYALGCTCDGCASYDGEPDDDFDAFMDEIDAAIDAEIAGDAAVVCLP